MSVLPGVVEQVGELEADRDPDQHRDARLLGDERADRGGALVEVLGGGRLAHRRLVRGAEPVGVLERLVEDPLQLRRLRGDGVLGRLEPARLGQRLHGRLELLVRVGVAVGHGPA